MAATASSHDQAGRISDAELRARQMQQAEELLFSGPARRGGFARPFFQGDFPGQALFPYPEPTAAERAQIEPIVDQVRQFVERQLDPAAIDRDADIPRAVIDGLGALGVLGMAAPVEFGGRGLSQSGYCRIMEVIGARCASTAVFVNAHHSIGLRALVLFGTPEQKSRWLPPLARGEKLAAFALTEEQAGSDASNVQTIAEPTPDGEAFLLTGTKRYITNGAIADVLTVMARTPDPKGSESRITAFLVTPDMPGFEIVEARMPKVGIRGTATARLAFHKMRVPAANILGPYGKGLKVALTVLDFGRTTFGASCTGVAKACLEAACRHAAQRRQFGRALAELELIKQKIAVLAANAYAMEAVTYQTAHLIDSGEEDYMLETAILKVFSTDAVWQGVYETLQVHGGQGYFNNEPYERMMRDARINTIGEGANEVLKAFIALVGARETGERFKAAYDRLKNPATTLSAIWSFGKDRLSRSMKAPLVPVRTHALQPFAAALARRTTRFGAAVERALIVHREAILDRQYVQERLADMAIALVTSGCVVARLDHQLETGSARPSDQAAAELYLHLAGRKFDSSLASMRSNDDGMLTRAANSALARFAP